MAMQTKVATFDGIVDEVAVTWTAMAGLFGVALGVTVTDASGPPGVALIDVIATGCTVQASAPFLGSVDLLIYDR